MPLLDSGPSCAFLIHTTKFAGNFLNEMLAFMTGQISRYELGGEQQEAYYQSNPDPAIAQWIVQNIAFITDDNGWLTAATTAPTDGYFHDGMNNLWPNNADPGTVRNVFNQCVNDYFGHWVQDFQTRGTNSNDSSLLEQANRYSATQGALLNQGPGNYPAYQTVAILFNASPPQNVIDFLKARANLFVQSRTTIADYTGIGIVGFGIATPPTTGWTKNSV